MDENTTNQANAKQAREILGFDSDGGFDCVSIGLASPDTIPYRVGSAGFAHLVPQEHAQPPWIDTRYDSQGIGKRHILRALCGNRSDEYVFYVHAVSH